MVKFRPVFFLVAKIWNHPETNKPWFFLRWHHGTIHGTIAFLILKMMQEREKGHKFRHNSGLFGVYMFWVYPWTTKGGK